MASRGANSQPIPINATRRSSSSAGSLPLARAISRGSVTDKLAPPSSASGSASRRRSSVRDRRPSANFVRAHESELTARSLGEEETVFEDLDVMSDGPAPRRTTGGKKGDDTYECEKCHKSYKHPACLTKHRWQHTEYWSSTSQLGISKHQSVQVLEAAAILLHATSLPEEKALWPAAVSPPTSGLLGAEQLNRETLRRFELNTAASPPMHAFAQLALEHSLGSVASTSTSQAAEPATDDAMDLDGDLELDADEMFEFEHAPRGRQLAQGGSNARSPSTAATTTMRSEGSASGGEDTFETSKRLLVNPQAAAQGAKAPANAFGLSAPQLGFFSPRQLATSKTDVDMS